MLNTDKIKNDFPILKRSINCKPIVYLDSTATSLKPQAVIDAMTGYYQRYTANVFRGIYALSEEATAAYESARIKIAKFIGVNDAAEIIFVRNTTEAINLFAYSYGDKNIHAGDEIIATIMEHHSNFVPWQQLALKKRAEFKICNLDSEYQLNLEELKKLITRKTKLLVITAVSNVIGTITPIRQITKLVKNINPKCLVLVDAAQAVPHMSVDIGNWGVDAVAFSGHKMLGPSGIGVLWARRRILESMPPFLYGGEMIREVHLKRTVFNEIPNKFEAGTPYIEGAIGLGAAVEYLSNIGMDNIRNHEKQITAYALQKLSKIPGLKIYGSTDPSKRGGVVAFTLNNIHPHDAAQALDIDNICVRVGYHCAEPLHEYLHGGPTIRASFYLYNDKSDVDALVAGIKKVQKLFL